MKRTILAAALLSAGLASQAMAEDTGLYFGGSLGWAYMEAKPGNLFDDDFDFSVDDDDFGWKAFAGWQMLPFLAVEGGYVDFGEAKDNNPLGSSRVSADAWDGFLVGNLPLGFIDLFAKIGVVYSDTDFKVSGVNNSFSDGDSSTDPAYGIGAAIELGSLSIRGEWEYFDVDGLKDLSMFSVGAAYTF
jgi:Outer membrane protein beta-barrel domain